MEISLRSYNFLIFLLSLVLVSPLSIGATECYLDLSRAHTIEKSSKQYAFSLELKNSHSLSQRPRYLEWEDSTYRSWVHDKFARVGVNFGIPVYNQIALIEKHASLYENASWVSASEKEQASKTIGNILELMRDQLRPINCLELSLHRIHHIRFPLDKMPSEFCAVVLRSRGQLKVYFNSEKLDFVGASCKIFDRAIKRDLSMGWGLFQSIHNHPFNFSNPYGDLGTLLPSSPDLLNSLKEGYKTSIITNGIESFEMKAKDIMLLNSL